MGWHSKSCLALCAGAALVEGFDTQAMGVAAPRVVVEFGLSPGQAGLLFSATTFGLFVGAAIGGRVADSWGRQRTLACSLLLFGFCSLATAVAIGPQSLFLARLITGLGLGAAMPNFIALSSEAAHPAHRLSWVTMVMAGLPFGGAIAAAIALGARWGWSWRSIFYVGGSAPIVLAFLLMLMPGNGDSTHREPGAARVPGVSATLFAAEQRATTLLLWCAFFFTQLVLLLMLNWLPILIVGLGFTRAQASTAAICFGLSGGFGAVLLGRMHAGPRRRQWVLLTYLGIALSLTAVAFVKGEFPVAALACAVAGIFIIGAQLILFALAPLYYREAARGTGVGAAVAIGRLGSVVGPLFAGALLATGSSSGAVLLAIVPFVIVGGCAAFALTWRAQCAWDTTPS
jgi:MFS transporter, AAHS family, 3-hydroxyphenylpropionic acid transporter